MADHATRAASLVMAGLISAAPAHAQMTDPVTGETFEPASYEEVLNNPDDISLNIRYARTEIVRGNLNSAASALARILMTRPDLARVRLLYAVVLYRMGNLSQALAEFRTLTGAGELSESQAKVVSRYTERIRERHDPMRWTGQVGGGIHYDTNRNAHPDANSFRILNGVIAAQGGSNADIGRMGLGTVRMTHDPGYQQLREVRVTAQGFVDDQVEENNLDIVYGALTTDAKIVTPTWDIIPKVKYEHYNVGDNPFAHIVTTGVRFEHRPETMPAFKTHIGFDVGYEDYINSSRLPQNDEDNGPIYSVSTGADYAFSDAFTVGGGYTFSRKVANQAFNSYLGHEISVKAAYTLPNRARLSASGGVAWDTYQAADPFIASNQIREDTDYRLKVQYALPVNVIAKSIGVSTDSWVTDNLSLAVSGSYVEEQSNIRNFDYNNVRTTTLLTKKFSF